MKKLFLIFFCAMWFMGCALIGPPQEEPFSVRYARTMAAERERLRVEEEAQNARQEAKQETHRKLLEAKKAQLREAKQCFQQYRTPVSAMRCANNSERSFVAEFFPSFTDLHEKYLDQRLRIAKLMEEKKLSIEEAGLMLEEAKGKYLSEIRRQAVETEGQRRAEIERLLVESERRSEAEDRKIQESIDRLQNQMYMDSLTAPKTTTCFRRGFPFNDVVCQTR